MLEKQVEKYLVDEVKKRGGVAYKFTSPGHVGVPDRILVMPDGVLRFVEVKAPGKRPTLLQQRTIERLNSLGHVALWVDSKESIDEVLNAL